MSFCFSYVSTQQQLHLFTLQNFSLNQSIIACKRKLNFGLQKKSCSLTAKSPKVCYIQHLPQLLFSSEKKEVKKSAFKTCSLSILACVFLGEGQTHSFHQPLYLHPIQETTRVHQLLLPLCSEPITGDFSTLGATVSFISVAWTSCSNFFQCLQISSGKIN